MFKSNLIAVHLACNKNKLYETLDYWSRGVEVLLNFDFLAKGLGIVSPPHFENGFSRIMVLMLYYIKDTLKAYH